MRYQYQKIIGIVSDGLVNEESDSPILRAWKETILHVTAHSLIFRTRMSREDALARAWEVFEAAARGYHDLLLGGIYRNLIASIHDSQDKELIGLLTRAFEAARPPGVTLYCKPEVFKRPVQRAGALAVAYDPRIKDAEDWVEVDWAAVDRLLSGAGEDKSPAPKGSEEPKVTKAPHLQLIVGGRGFV